MNLEEEIKEIKVEKETPDLKPPPKEIPQRDRGHLDMRDIILEPESRHRFILHFKILF